MMHFLVQFDFDFDHMIERDSSDLQFYSGERFVLVHFIQELVLIAQNDGAFQVRLVLSI